MPRAEFLRAERQSLHADRPRRAGHVAIDFGLYGVPETYLVDKAGIVRWRWAGGLTEDVVRQSLRRCCKSLA